MTGKRNMPFKPSWENQREKHMPKKSPCIPRDAPIIPISANRGVNIDMLIQAIEDNIVAKIKRDAKAAPLMHVARSFDINSPGTKPEDLKGGVLGGTLIQGTLKVGDEIEISPGRKTEVAGKAVYERITATVTSLEAGGRSVKSVVPGGLIAIGTGLDASITKSDGLTGRVIGVPGELPAVVHDFKMKTTLLDRVVGSSSELSVTSTSQSQTVHVLLLWILRSSIMQARVGRTTCITSRLPMRIPRLPVPPSPILTTTTASATVTLKTAPISV